MREFTAEDIADMISNPVYAGIGPYPPVVSDEEWVSAAIVGINEHGAAEFLFRMLRVLRGAMQNAVMDFDD